MILSSQPHPGEPQAKVLERSAHGPGGNHPIRLGSRCPASPLAAGDAASVLSTLRWKCCHPPTCPWEGLRQTLNAENHAPSTLEFSPVDRSCYQHSAVPTLCSQMPLCSDGIASVRYNTDSWIPKVHALISRSRVGTEICISRMFLR